LTPAQAERASRHGLACAERAERNGWSKNVHTEVPSRWRSRQASGAELALAVWLGDESRWVDDLDAFRDLPDVLPDLEVRWIRRDYWQLPIYGDDHLERRFVLVAGLMPIYELRGWISGNAGASVGRRYPDPPHGKLIAQPLLWPMSALRR
jgi:hypothetical protein